MAVIELKHLHTVKAGGRVYHYAWRGGPRVHGTPGTPEFQASYNAAVADARMPDTRRFRSVVVRYKASDDWKNLAASTRKNWSPWLDRIADHFGDLRTAQFDRPEKIRPQIRRWRAKYASTPRTADYGMQVLSRVLSYCVDPLGEIARNPVEGIGHLYSADRSDIIWTDDDIAQLKQHCSAEVGYAVDLAAHTGLRISDLMALSWSHVGDNAIEIRTGKRSGRSKKQRIAVVPLYAELRELLARIPRRSPVVLTNARRHRPWTVNGFNSSFTDAKREAWPKGDDLHFHDLRGTAATKFYLGGLTIREIAETLAWDEDAVEKIIRRYVGRRAAIDDRIRRLDAARKPAKNAGVGFTDPNGTNGLA